MNRKEVQDDWRSASLSDISDQAEIINMDRVPTYCATRLLKRSSLIWWAEATQAGKCHGRGSGSREGKQNRRFYSDQRWSE
jgi:ribosomal protein L19E